MENLRIVTIAGNDYTVENWSGMDVLVSKKGTGYIVRPGIGQPTTFPGGTPMRKRGNPVYVLNVGGIIEESTSH